MFVKLIKLNCKHDIVFFIGFISLQRETRYGINRCTPLMFSHNRVLLFVYLLNIYYLCMFRLLGWFILCLSVYIFVFVFSCLFFSFHSFLFVVSFAFLQNTEAGGLDAGPLEPQLEAVHGRRREWAGMGADRRLQSNEHSAKGTNAGHCQGAGRLSRCGACLQGVSPSSASCASPPAIPERLLH